MVLKHLVFLTTLTLNSALALWTEFILPFVRGKLRARPGLSLTPRDHTVSHHFAFYFTFIVNMYHPPS